jgi:hypothetical protein
MEPPYNMEIDGAFTQRKFFIQKIFTIWTKGGFLNLFWESHSDIEFITNDLNMYIGFNSLEDAYLEIGNYKKMLPKIIHVK